MSNSEARYHSINPVEILDYKKHFDSLLNGIAVCAIDDNDIVSSILFNGLYVPQTKWHASKAGISVKITPKKAVKIYIVFEALLFDRKKTILDRLLKRKKDIENLHVSMVNKSLEMYGDVDRSVSPLWAEAYMRSLEQSLD